MTESLLVERDDPNAVRLSELDPSERETRFGALQDRMEAVWDDMKLDLADESVVVLPSVTCPAPWPPAVR